MKKWVKALIALIVLVALIIILGLIKIKIKAPREETIISGVSGLQGIISNIDFPNSRLTLSVSKVVDRPGGPSVEEKEFTVLWDDGTLFFAYISPADVSANKTVTISSVDLKTNRVAVVKPRRQTSNTVTAAEVRILPGSTKAVVIE